MIKIIVEYSDEQIYEFYTDNEGRLSVSSIKAIFPTANALKYAKDGKVRICNQVGDYFDTPENGWGDTTYFVNLTGNIGTPAIATQVASPAPVPISQHPRGIKYFDSSVSLPKLKEVFSFLLLFA